LEDKFNISLELSDFEKDKMLKFARRRARSSEREPVKCLMMNNTLSKPRASSAERASMADVPDSKQQQTFTLPVLTPSRTEARTAVRRSCLFEDSETDLPAYSVSVNDSTVTVRQLDNKMGQVQLGESKAEVISDSSKQSLSLAVRSTHPVPPVLPRKPKLENFLSSQHRHLWKMELLDTSAESGYGTDSSDNNSLKSVNSNTEETSDPPPLPKRKPRRRVQFDSYVLLIQSLKDRDLKGVVSTIFNVSSEALCTEDVIYHFHTAILRQDYEVFELLVRGGVDVNTFDHRGWSALHCASSLARLDMIKLLLQNGAAVLARTHHSSQTATQLLPLDNPAYPQCLAYMRCMEECLGTVNNGLVLAAANYRACRVDELTISKGDRMYVVRRGDVNNEMWWWVKNGRAEEGYVLRDLLSLNSRHS